LIAHENFNLGIYLQTKQQIGARRRAMCAKEARFMLHEINSHAIPTVVGWALLFSRIINFLAVFCILMQIPSFIFIRYIFFSLIGTWTLVFHAIYIFFYSFAAPSLPICLMHDVDSQNVIF
jgi:hypothetical protein